ncbi:MAG TPA: DUF3800 domain-containing protein [Pseudoxanthomonas sp.]|nr:DUF3800 domain-containing protein [Pseudoxanthomonas sp.]
MHFFYLDESGDTGTNLTDVEQPVFVLGGISVSDKKWNNTKEALDRLVLQYFSGEIPNNFELHACELLSPSGEGAFLDHDIGRRLELVRSLLMLIEDLGHSVHYFAVEKSRANIAACSYPTAFDAKNPYLISFDCLVTHINWYVKEGLGQSARGMLVLDEKPEHHESIEKIIHDRRFSGAAAHRVKWIVEFSYPVDSKKNPMIQLSDLVVLCIRRFLEIELGYKTSMPDVAKNFYAECYARLVSRMKAKKLIERKGKNANIINTFLGSINAKPALQWRRKYSFERESKLR